MAKVQTKARHLRRQQLDSKFSKIDRDALIPPKRGWVWAIRFALGMNTRHLAERLETSTGNIAHLEAAEQAGSINMDTLRRAADALDCDVVYALVPRAGSLEEALESRAQKVARALVEQVSSTMALEAQGTDEDAQNYLVRETAKELVRELRKSLWDTPL